MIDRRFTYNEIRQMESRRARWTPRRYRAYQTITYGSILAAIALGIMGFWYPTADSTEVIILWALYGHIRFGWFIGTPYMDVTKLR